MGRRWGKTVLGGSVTLATSVRGGRVAWVVPGYKNGRPLWRWAEAATAPLRKRGLCRIDRSERLIEFANGGFLGIYSADNPDSMRGESFHLVVMDEAARISEEAWTDAIQPTLADVGGEAILISTPKGRNWFWVEWQKGRERTTEQASFTAPSCANPNPNIQHAAAMARERVPERSYRQEWEAEFVEDGGEVFRFVRRAARALVQSERLQDHNYAFGVDWGKQHDFTVISVWDLNLRSCVRLERFNRIDYTFQVGRLRALAANFRPLVILAEENSMGTPLIEQLQRGEKVGDVDYPGLPVQPFLTTNASKKIAVEALALGFERDEVTIPCDEQAIAELEAYEVKLTPSRVSTYSAPAGMHDDIVMSLVIGYQAIGQQVRYADGLY